MAPAASALSQRGIVALFQSQQLLFDYFHLFGELKNSFENFTLGSCVPQFGNHGMHPGDACRQLIAFLTELRDGRGGVHAG